MSPHDANIPTTENHATPSGEFMTPLPLTKEFLHQAPASPGCYLIYAGPHPYYAGMSTRSIRNRLRAHLTGRGSKMVHRLLAVGQYLYFEYYDLYPWEGTTLEEVRDAEFLFMTMHTGELLPGNLRADNYKMPPPSAEFLTRMSNPVPIAHRQYATPFDPATVYAIEIRQSQQVYVIRCRGEFVKAAIGEATGTQSVAELYKKACEDIDQFSPTHTNTP